jgi:hypothetical protein
MSISLVDLCKYEHNLYKVNRLIRFCKKKLNHMEVMQPGMAFNSFAEAKQLLSMMLTCAEEGTRTLTAYATRL